MSGSITLEQKTPLIKATGNLQVQYLTAFGDTLGNLEASMNNSKDNMLDTKIILKGNGNDISVTGLYNFNSNNGNALNFDAKIDALAVHSFEGMAMHQVKK